MSVTNDSPASGSRCIECNEEIEEDSSLYEKKSRIIEAAVQNNVELLRELLDSPRWYTVENEWGLNLLQIAIGEQHVDLFEYLISIDNFPLNATDQMGQPPLATALRKRKIIICEDTADHFACELINKGADIHWVCHEGNSFLHQALDVGYEETAKLLIEKGINVNIQNEYGETPLHLAAYKRNYEILALLLYHGADLTLRHDGGATPFDVGIWRSKCDDCREIMFNYLFDQYTRYTIPAGALLEAIDKELPLFYQILDNIEEISVDDVTEDYCPLLFKMKPEYLQILLERFDYVITAILSSYCSKYKNIWNCYQSKSISIENFYILMESKVKLEMIDFLVRSTGRGHFLIDGIVQSNFTESETTELLCYLLSYGVNIHLLHLQTIYKKFGCCQLFKILLHMKMEQPATLLTDIMPRLLVDVSTDIGKILEDPNIHSQENLRTVLSYCSLSRLQKYVSGMTGKLSSDLKKKIHNHPQVPRLVELGRDVFRQHFVQTFKITNPSQFYTLLKVLPISTVHKKIIIYETQLY